MEIKKNKSGESALTVFSKKAKKLTIKGKSISEIFHQELEQSIEDYLKEENSYIKEEHQMHRLMSKALIIKQLVIMLFLSSKKEIGKARQTSRKPMIKTIKSTCKPAIKH